MAAPLLPQDVTEHLEAAIQLSNRRVHLRFLDEAESLLALNLPAAAVLVTGVVLEAVLARQGVSNLQKWTELRERVAHHELPDSLLSQAREMIADVRQALTREISVLPRRAR